MVQQAFNQLPAAASSLPLCCLLWPHQPFADEVTPPSCTQPNARDAGDIHVLWGVAHPRLLVQHPHHIRAMGPVLHHPGDELAGGPRMQWPVPSKLLARPSGNRSRGCGGLPSPHAATPPLAPHPLRRPPSSCASCCSPAPGAPTACPPCPACCACLSSTRRSSSWRGRCSSARQTAQGSWPGAWSPPPPSSPGCPPSCLGCSRSPGRWTRGRQPGRPAGRSSRCEGRAQGQGRK